MRRNLQLGFACGLLAALPLSGYAQLPSPPKNLKGTASGHTVTLSWDNGDQGDLLLYNGFECDPTDFPGEGWSTIVTDVVDPITTWFQFPNEKFEGMDNIDRFIHSGEKSAFVYFDPFVPRQEGSVIPPYQNEWLISPTLDGAAYLVFNFFINPSLLEVGQYDEFTNHYYVMVSNDNGENWEPVWDARYDMLNIDGYQQAVVCLGEPTDSMKFAFVACSDPEDELYGLYYCWTIDDVYVYSSMPEAAPGRVFGKMAPQGSTCLEFNTEGLTRSNLFQHAPKYSPAKKPLAYHYNIYRDGELLAANHHSLSFSDYDAKEEGTYLYEVRTAGEEGESEAASVEVRINPAVFAAPKNFEASSEFDEDSGYYILHFRWENAEGDFIPAYYNLFWEGSSAAFFTYEKDAVYELSYTDVEPGTYLYELQAFYDNPEGESEKLVKWITVGQRSTATGVTAETKANEVTLSWGKPTAPDCDDLVGYDVYRGANKIAENLSSTSFVDSNVENGAYCYSIVCVYNDGSESLPKSARLKVGNGVKLYPIPHSETFDTTFQPDNWQISSNYDQTPVQYQFRFDNYYDIEIDGGDFEGNFVSATNEVPAFIIVADYLTSPTYDIASVEDPSKLTLGFDYDFHGSGYSLVIIEYSLDNGETWETWTDPEMIPYYTDQDLAEKGAFSIPMKFQKNFSEIATANTITFRVYFESFFDKHFALDNWKVFIDGSQGVSASIADSSVKISRNGNAVEIKAEENILSAEAIDLSGKVIASAANASTACTLNVAESSFYIVKVTTVNGTKVCKFSGK